MKHKKQIFSSMLLLFMGIGITPAQQALPTAGGNANGSGGTASYTLGQVVYTTQTGSGGSVTQGVQVPYEITVVTSAETAKDFNLSYSVYPNPTADNLTLKIDIANDIKYNATLFDAKGKQLLSFQVEGNETSISMQDYAPAVYFLKITNNNKEVKTFKIIKK